MEQPSKRVFVVTRDPSMKHRHDWDQMWYDADSRMMQFSAGCRLKATEFETEEEALAAKIKWLEAHHSDDPALYRVEDDTDRLAEASKNYKFIAHTAFQPIAWGWGKDADQAVKNMKRYAEKDGLKKFGYLVWLTHPDTTINSWGQLGYRIGEREPIKVIDKQKHPK